MKRVPALSWSQASVLAAALATACGLRVVYALGSGLWRDEAQTLHVAALPSIRALVEFVAQQDSHPAGYYLLVRAWTHLSPPGAGWEQAPGIVFGVAAVWVAFVLGRGIGGVWSGCAAAWLIAVSPVVVRYSAMARPYGFSSLVLLTGAFALWRAGVDGGARWLVLFAMTAVFALYTHSWSALPLASMVGVMFWLSWRREVAVTPRALLFAGLGVGLVWAGWLPTLLYQSKHNGHFSPDAAVWVRVLYLSVAVLPGMAVLGLLATGLGSAGVVLLRTLGRVSPLAARQRVGLTLVGSTPLVTMVLAAIGSLHTNLLVSQAVSMVTPFTLLTAALVLTPPVAVRGRMLATACLVVVLASSAWESVEGARTPRSNTWLAAEIVNEGARSEDVVVVVPLYVLPSFDHYYHGAAPVLSFPDGVVDGPIGGNDRVLRDTSEAYVGPAIDRVEKALEEGRRVWVVRGRVGRHSHRAVTRLDAALNGAGGQMTVFRQEARRASLEDVSVTLVSPPRRADGPVRVIAP